MTGPKRTALMTHRSPRMDHTGIGPPAPVIDGYDGVCFSDKFDICLYIWGVKDISPFIERIDC